MKRIVLVALLLIVSLSGMGQNIGDAFYIYRNDGQFNAFFRDEVDSIAYSYYDSDSVYYDEIVTQLVYTADSLYRIPLAAIDSVGFVQPETVYKEDAVVLSGDLFDYLISADSLVLTFSPSIPYSLLPKVSDKIVTMELTDKLPCGFAGKVRSIENIGDNIVVSCDSLAFEEAVRRFYGVAEIVSQYQDGEVRRYLPRKAPIAIHTYLFNPNIPDFNLPISLEGVISPKKVFKSFEGKASANMHITPTLTGRAVYVIDNQVVPTHYQIHVVTDLKTESVLDVAGVAKGEFVNWWLNHDVPMPWGYPLYLAFGPMLEVEGDVALGFNLQADVRHIEDITYYPFASITPVTQVMFNKIDQSTRFTRFNIDWRYFALKGSAKVGFKARVGLPIPKHETAWFGGEFQFGERIDAELNVNFDAIEQAETGTAFYEALKSSSLSEMSYGGAQFCVMGLGDRLRLKFGRDDYDFGGKRVDRDLMPIFSDTKAEPKGSSAKVSADITNDCIIPYTVGFSLFDENNNRIGEPQWNSQKYWTHDNFNFPFETTFADLATDKKYKVYPTMRLFGLFPVLATPSADIDMHIPVTLSDFEVIYKEYRKGGFHHEGVDYDFCFGVSVTATLDDDAEGIEDWGYIYMDPNGREAKRSLSKFGKQFTDDRWDYYRNEAHSTCTLYGYVKYEGSDELVYGEPHDYPLEYDVVEAYGVLSEDSTLLTYYYDDKIYEKKGQITFFGCTDGIITVSFDVSFANCLPESTAGWFTGESLTSIEHIEYLNTSNVTDMSRMFSGCSSLTSLDLSRFNTSNVTYMGGMFSGCSSLTSLDLSSFNTSNVTDMGWMFSGCSSLTSLDLSRFNTSNVTDMGWMFSGCSSLMSLDLSRFNTSNVTNMYNMFYGCSSLTSLNLSSFNTSNVTDMAQMFYGCSSLTSLDLSSFNTSNVTSMESMEEMFYGCSSLKDLDISNFNINANIGIVYSNYQMFSDCPALESINASNLIIKGTGGSALFSRCPSVKTINLSNANTSEATYMAAMFYGCSSLTSLDLSSFNTSNVTEMGMRMMFSGCSSLTSLDLSSFNTSNVTGMGSMFSGCSSLTSLDLSSFNTSNVTNMYNMFKGCSSLTSLDVSNFNIKGTEGSGLFIDLSSVKTINLSNANTSEATDMELMFDGCSSLTSLDRSSFNTSNVTDMRAMFGGCESLTSLDLSSFNTSNVTDMGGMFSGCSSLTSLNLSSFNTSNVTDMGWMFYGCSSIKTIYAGNWSRNNQVNGYGIFDSCDKLTGGRGTKIGQNHYGYDKNGKPLYYYCYGGFEAAHIDGGKDNPGLFTGN
ncbi:MAG: BspA family leucine-rich repeat surface protein [Bacteroidaceae bacterium]|nr:BspA family leucine-rich repeat surface protein [Bacteroidaceae bacterium]